MEIFRNRFFFPFVCLMLFCFLVCFFFACPAWPDPVSFNRTFISSLCIYSRNPTWLQLSVNKPSHALSLSHIYIRTASIVIYFSVLFSFFSPALKRSVINALKFSETFWLSISWSFIMNRLLSVSYTHLDSDLAARRRERFVARVHGSYESDTTRCNLNR